MKRTSLPLVVILCVVVPLTVGCSLPRISLFGEPAGPLKEITLQGTAEGKILVLPVEGAISGKPKRQLVQRRPSLLQQTVAYLKRAEKDPEIKALLIKVNSPGGTVTASDILYHEISAYKKRTGVKVVVSMMNVAASGAYYISLPADHIMAHPTTVTGSIGVIFMRPGVSGLMEKVGLSVAVSTSGEQKDMGTPFRPPTEQEKAIFQELTDEMAQRFLSLVVKHRKLTPDQKEQIASARIYLAPQAKDLGLVDQIGYLDDAVAKAKELAHLPADARVITYRRYEPEDDTIYNPSIAYQNDDMASTIPLLSPLTAAGQADFCYIWPAALAQ